jgi:hypothetical protein
MSSLRDLAAGFGTVSTKIPSRTGLIARSHLSRRGEFKALNNNIALQGGDCPYPSDARDGYYFGRLTGLGFSQKVEVSSTV